MTIKSGFSYRSIATSYDRSEAARFGIGMAEFCRILNDVRRACCPNASEAEAAAFWTALHVEDLVLARACANGNEEAWRCLLARYGSKLRRTALGVAKRTFVARELADSVCADLFGISTTTEEERISKLNVYMGRCSLERWLQMIVVQSYVDSYRVERRFVSLEDSLFASAPAWMEEDLAGKITRDGRMESALRCAFNRLNAQERFILSAYFFDGRTLTELGKILDLHESSVSRRIGKITRSLRKEMTRELHRRGMSGRAVAESLHADVHEFTFDLRALLRGE